LAGPVAILAEPILDATLRDAAQYFASSGLVHEREQGRFTASLYGIARLRHSAVAEVLLLLLAFVYSFRVQHAVDLGQRWLMTPSAPAVWYVWVSRPLLNFLLVRWLWRFALWTAFLFRTSRLSLRPAAAHPDRAGGLGFLGEAHARFGLVVFSFSTVWSAGWRDRFLEGAVTADSLKVSFAIFAGVVAVIFLGPLLVFSPTLFALRRRGMLGYGRLAVKYVHMFENRWIRETAPTDDSLLGTADIQSLGDLQTSVGAVRDVRILPLDKRDLIIFSIGIVLPVLGLLQLVIPVADLVRRALGPFL
jgi:hypothetical protein